MKQGKSVAKDGCGGSGGALLYSRVVREDLTDVTCELGAREWGLDVWGREFLLEGRAVGPEHV